MDAGLIFGIVSFLVAQLGGAVWFASKLNTVVAQLTTAVYELKVEVRQLSRQSADIAVLQEKTRSLEEWVEACPIRVQ